MSHVQDSGVGRANVTAPTLQDGVGSDPDPQQHHLSDQQHFAQSPDPGERERGLGVYSSYGASALHQSEFTRKYYESLRSNPALSDDGN